MEGQAHPRYYEQYLDHTILSESFYIVHYPYIMALQKELSDWLFFYFEPREKMRQSSPIKDINTIGSMGEDLASYLYALKSTHENSYKSIIRSIKLAIPSITDLNVEINNSNGEAELSIIENGIQYSSRIISEGTLRIIGLISLFLSKDPVNLIGFEEPKW
jgi:predicted ATPase